MDSLRIKFRNSQYPLFIGVDISDQIGELLQLYRLDSGVVFIIDSELTNLYKKVIVENLSKYQICTSEIFIRGGESSKNLQTVDYVCQELNKLGQAHIDTIIAFGGGVTANIAGMASCLLNKSVNLIHIPSTLVAQINSSICDTAYLNIAADRNKLSVNYKFQLVLSDSGFLRTLSKYNIYCGLAYALRYSLMRSSELFEFLENHLDDLKSRNIEKLNRLVVLCCEIRLSYINSSLFHYNDPEFYNFGEFIASLLENFENRKKMNAGEALIWGMLVEAEVAQKAGVFNKTGFKRFDNLLRRLVAELPGLKFDNSLLFENLKRRLPGKKLIIPGRIGELKIVDGFNDDIFVDSVKSLKRRI